MLPLYKTKNTAHFVCVSNIELRWTVLFTHYRLPGSGFFKADFFTSSSPSVAIRANPLSPQIPRRFRLCSSRSLSRRLLLRRYVMIHHQVSFSCDFLLIYIQSPISFCEFSDFSAFSFSVFCLEHWIWIHSAQEPMFSAIENELGIVFNYFRSMPNFWLIFQKNKWL